MDAASEGTPAVATADGEPVTIKLRKPIEFAGKTITEMTLSFSSKALKGFKLEMSPQGVPIFEPYPLLQLGVKLAGYQSVVADMFTNGKDASEVSNAALGFIS